MNNYWESYPSGTKELLRRLTRDGKWLAWADQEPDPTDAAGKRIPGCREQVEETLQTALHSTNVVVLLGSGASFSAQNEGGPKAPSMGDLWHTVRSDVTKDEPKDDLLGSSRFDAIVRKVMGGLPADEGQGEKKAGDIESLLSLCKMSIELLQTRFKKDEKFAEKDWLDQLTDFVKVAERVILREVGFVNSATALPAHTAFLRKFARRAPEKPRVKLFTTNYDLCIETAALRLGVVLIDGFSHSAEQRFNRDHFHHDIVRRSASSTKADYLDGVFHLYKLHGSVDWRRKKDEIVTRSLREPNADFKPVLIYPRSSKYQEAFESPYLDMFAAFQAALREPDTTLIISGFGFADDHISAPIWSAIETNLSLKVILCDRGFVPYQRLDGGEHGIDLEIGTQKQYQRKIMKLVQQGDTRISILNGRFEDLADAVPMVSGKTDRQLLQDRLDGVRKDGGE